MPNWRVLQSGDAGNYEPGKDRNGISGKAKVLHDQKCGWKEPIHYQLPFPDGRHLLYGDIVTTRSTWMIEIH